jgi:hypothetical protein
MNQLISTLQELIRLKKESIASLFTLQTIQTELEYDLAILQIEFRYDEEYDFSLYESQIIVFNQELSILDSDIAHILASIEYFSFKIATL